MIADNRETTSEVVLRLVTAPLWVPIYLTYLGCRKAAQVMARSEAGEQKPVWLPATEIERAVYAALILAGEPVNNRRLASLMGCSPGEA
jgi:hypothetical protein